MDGVAFVCALVHALCGGLPFSMAPPFCVGVEGVDMCEGVRVAVVPAHLLLPHTLLLSTASCSTQAVDRENVRVCSKQDNNKMQFMTANLIRGWLQRVEHVRQYALDVALMIGEERRHDIVALCVLCGRGMPAIVRTWRTRSCLTGRRMWRTLRRSGSA
ncbi:elongation factor 1-gamma (EF-1-gamma) [Trypanosoma cruzi]|nr:elongation factor 1-gamma (EF-1-gamma) [Trypanosoma cruzi]